ncbi:MAG: hypothetical protein JGK24_13315 [Microcoleus sp. PH2017_29_MFU_D_A]|uniref:hypothetical protein n=1 Tax=unclassified Microcoleus TaxID=2642155 RepID=UPI001D84FEDE|nr:MULTISPECIES: hypothetical protein [unclassified Microcoleus]MCC3431201.1 hypothetical protein [Microcoleus sp. PH2017_04_SCI_O_A]MCC3512322.1 hypothetical protein [Microcoleus sp. PH2017_17_BER_D_A]MCC3424497.1 hypothetical protein [Microcoleus sp. PH2017_01_SCD_O_A]MCC3604198.1 hypothetical protein [Microcoleus sp. PH2017_29_MFU_D_A]MCC3635034.1 hypothetical protein [Microcoleus sp. PH2017_37_MFU_D_B]
MSISGLWLKKAKSAIARGINTTEIPQPLVCHTEQLATTLFFKVIYYTCFLRFNR